MTRKRSGKAIPKFSSDRAAAEFWSANDSAAYAAHLEEARVTVNPRLRRRIAERAAQKKAITLRLETQQIERAKLVAQRKSIPYQTLMRMWIAEGLAKEGVEGIGLLFLLPFCSHNTPKQGGTRRRTTHHQTTWNRLLPNAFPARSEGYRAWPCCTHNPKVAGSNPAPATTQGQGVSGRRR